MTLHQQIEAAGLAGWSLALLFKRNAGSAQAARAASGVLRIELSVTQGDLLTVSSWIGDRIDTSYLPVSQQTVLEKVLPQIVAEWRAAQGQSGAVGSSVTE